VAGSIAAPWKSIAQIRCASPVASDFGQPVKGIAIEGGISYAESLKV
jgi:hypothetical protein